MTRKKFWILIASILVFISVGLVITAVVLQNWALSKLSHSIQHRLDDLQWQIQIEPPSAIPTSACLKTVALHHEQYGDIVLNDVCLDSGMRALFDNSQDLSVSCETIEAAVDWNAINQISQLTQRSTKSSESLPAENSRFHLADRNILAVVKNTHVRLGHKGQMLELRSANDTFEWKNYTAWADLTLSPSLIFKQFPVAFRNLPQIRLVAMANLKQKSANVFVDLVPDISVAYAIDDQVVEVAVHQISAIANLDALSVELGDICIHSDAFEFVSDACIDTIQVDFDGFKPSKENLKTIAVNHPVLSLDIQKLLKSKSVTENPILSGLVSFWKQDAGAILGNAPNKSVRKADVKKNVPITRKNPIPEKTLLSIRAAFDRVQQTILKLPIIDIDDGHIDIINHNARFAFDAISFNTADLFKNNQQFQLDFNVRQANAQFVIQYSDATPYPAIDLKIDNLSSADFLRILNMPIPEGNDGRVSLKCEMAMDDNAARVSGDIAFSNFAFYHPKVSPNLVHDIQASAKIDASYVFRDDLLKIEPIALTSGPLTVAGHVNIQNVRSNPTIEFQLGAETMKCEDLPKAIPAGLLPTITELKITGGTFSPTITGKIPWNYPLTATLRETGFEGHCFPLEVSPHLPEILNDDDYTFTTDYTYFVKSITVGPGTSGFVDLSDIPPYVKAAMFLTEDKRMFDHGPLRIAFIERALRLNLNQRKYVYGGSTIAQQLTKNLFLSRNKNLARKLEEAFIAWRLVSVVPKSRILELYLNMIEFGPDVYGIQKAAHFYFNKQAKELSPLEGAYLASLKVSPSKGGKYYKLGFAATGRWWNKRLRYIMRVLAETGYISGIDVLSAYDWTPKFYYPPTSMTSDYRNIWLNKYGSYLRDKTVKKP